MHHGFIGEAIVGTNEVYSEAKEDLLLDFAIFMHWSLLLDWSLALVTIEKTRSVLNEGNNIRWPKL